MNSVINKQIRKAITIGLVVLAAGCFPLGKDDPKKPGGSGDGTPPVSNPQPSFSAESGAIQTSFENTLISFLDGIAESVINNEAVVEFLDDNENNTNPESSLVRQTADLVRAEVEDLKIKEVLGYFLSNGERLNEKTIRYKPDTKVCVEIFAKNNPQDCVELIEKVRIVQVYNDSINVGSIDFQFDGTSVFILSYEPNILGLTLNADTVLSVLRFINAVNEKVGEELVDLPQSMSGVVNVALSKIDSNNINLSIGVSEGILIDMNDGGGLSVARSDELLNIRVHPQDRIAVAKLDLKGLSVAFPEYEKDSNTNVHMVEIDVSKLSGQISVDAVNQKIELLNGSHGFTPILVYSDGLLEIMITFDEMNLRLERLSELRFKATALSEVDFFMLFTNQTKILGESGTLEIIASANTVLEFLKNSEDGPVLHSGSIRIYGTGDFAIDEQLPRLEDDSCGDFCRSQIPQSIDEQSAKKSPAHKKCKKTHKHKRRK